MSVQLLCAYATEFVKIPTDYEANNFVTPRPSSLNMILCKLNGLGDMQTMKVDLAPLLTILGQREFENNLKHISANF